LPKAVRHINSEAQSFSIVLDSQVGPTSLFIYVPELTVQKAVVRLEFGSQPKILSGTGIVPGSLFKASQRSQDLYAPNWPSG
jgi:hypothetical protein